jgi:hypothetical protein
MALMLKSVLRFQGCREGPGLDLVFPNFSMGTIFHPACNVFDRMPARKIFLNFEILFGGL